WTASGTQISRGTADLTYAGLQNPAVVNNTRITNNGSGGSAHKQFWPTPFTSGSVYASLLFKLDALPMVDGDYHMFFGLYYTNTVSANSGAGFQEIQSAASVYVKRTDANHYQIGAFKQPTTVDAAGG